MSCLALAVLLIAQSLGVADGATSTARMAHVTGDARPVGAIVDRLMGHGVLLANADETAWLVVIVRSEGNSLRVSLRDGDGRQAERVVSDANTAAAVVESWLDVELTQPLLDPTSGQGDVVGAPLLLSPGESPAADATPSAAESFVVPRVVAVVEPHAPIESPPTGAALSAAAETGYAWDKSLWMGFSAGVSLEKRGVRFGVVIRLASNVLGAPTPIYKGMLGGSLERTTADGLLTIAKPWQVGRTTITASLGAGTGSLRSAARMDMHEGKATVTGPRVDTGLATSWPLTSGLQLECVGDLSIAPLAHRGVISDHKFDMPGEPITRLRVGVGLRYQVQ